jgi:DNA-binding transcriptional regulator GbsR (MarR family)
MWERDVPVTSTTETTPMRREIEDRVLQEWAELATAWGVSPVLGRIHGLLLLNGQPMTAEEICDRLQISRASASVQLNAIIDWGLARRLYVPGDRRQYYQGDQDHWSWFRRAAIVRKRREFDPVVERIGEALATVREAAREDAELTGLSERLANLHRFVGELFRGVGLVLEEEEALLHYLLSLSPQDLDELRQILRLALGRPEHAEGKAGQNGSS